MLSVCFHCGHMGNMAVGEDIQDLQRRYSVVRPICLSCKAQGKEVMVRCEKNVSEKRKKVS